MTVPQTENKRPSPETGLIVQLRWYHAAIALLLLSLAIVSLLGAALLPSWLYWAFKQPAIAQLGGSLAGAVALLSVLLALVNLWTLRRLQPGTRGRARLIVLSVAAVTLPLSELFASQLIFASLTNAHLNPFREVVDWRSISMLAEAPLLSLALGGALTVAVVSLGALTFATISCWFLLPSRVRHVMWLAFDVLLACSVAGSIATDILVKGQHLTLLFPFEAVVPVRLGSALLLFVIALSALGRLRALQEAARWSGRIAMLLLSLSAPFFGDLSVPQDAPDRVLPAATLLTLMALLLVRAHARWLPIVADGIEKLGVEALVAARHLRSKKSDYLTTISVISIVAIMTACATLTLVLSVMGGFRNDLKRKIIGNSAYVVIDADQGTFASWEPLLASAREIPHVTGASPYVAGEVMVTSATNLAGAVLRGVDPKAVRGVIELERNLTQGRLKYLEEPRRLLDLPPEETFDALNLELPLLEDLPPPDFDAAFEQGENTSLPRQDSQRQNPRGEDEHFKDPPAAATEQTPAPKQPLIPAAPPKKVLPGIIVGRELARSLRLFLGDEVNVVSPFGSLGPQGPMPKSRPFRVAGIFYSGMYEYDMKHVYVLLENAQRFLNVGNEVSGIELKTTTINHAPAVAEALREQIQSSGQEPSAFGGASLRVQDWRELNQNLFGALELERLSMFILLGFAILTAGFCVFATVTLMVQEKRPQVGILLAMGTKARTIVTVFLLEGFLLGGLGSVFGLGLGYLACFSTEHFGLRMDPEVYYIDRLPVHLDPMEFALVGISALVVCVLSTIFPATVASQLRPVDAMRYD